MSYSDILAGVKKALENPEPTPKFKLFQRVKYPDLTYKGSEGYEEVYEAQVIGIRYHGVASSMSLGDTFLGFHYFLEIDELEEVRDAPEEMLEAL